MPATSRMKYRRRRTTKLKYRGLYTQRGLGIYKGRPGVSIYQKPVLIKRSVLLRTQQISGGGGDSITFMLSDLPNYTDFTNFFDFYKIKGVKLKLIPCQNVATTSAGSGYNIPRISYFWDYNDNNVPLTQNEMLERDNVRTVMGNRIIKTFARPCPQEPVFVSGLVTGYEQGSRNKWLNITNNNIPHYGFKIWYDGDSSSVIQTYKVFATYYIQLKDSK